MVFLIPTKIVLPASVFFLVAAAALFFLWNNEFNSQFFPSFSNLQPDEYGNSHPNNILFLITIWFLAFQEGTSGKRKSFEVKRAWEGKPTSFPNKFLESSTWSQKCTVPVIGVLTTIFDPSSAVLHFCEGSISNKEPLERGKWGRPYSHVQTEFSYVSLLVSVVYVVYQLKRKKQSNNENPTNE